MNKNLKTKTLNFKLFFIVMLLFATAQAGQPDVANILPYPILQKKLSNGANVVTVPFNSPGLAAFYIVMRVGSRDEVEEGKSGFAHFFEHMMFRGTDKYPNEKYNEVLKVIGASANANTSLDRTVYHMTGNAEMLDKMFEIEADRFMNLHYSEQAFKTEAGAVKGEYTKNSSNPMNQLDEKISDVAFTQHTYKHTTMGFFKDVVDMPNQYQYSQDFYKRFYRPELATIIVVGDVTSEKVNQLAEKYFGVWKTGYTPKPITTEPEQNETRYAHVQMPNFPAALSLNFKGPAFSDATNDYEALDILCKLLFSEKSDLYKKLVTKEQKLRSLDPTVYFTRDPYLVGVNASFVNEKELISVYDEIKTAIEKIKTTPVNEKDLADTKSRMKYSFAMRIDNPTSIAESLSYFTWVSGDPESINKAYRHYDSVTAADIARVAKKYLVENHLTIGTITSGDASPFRR